MKTQVMILGFVLAALAAAQEKVTVPVSNPALPVTIKAHLLSGSITLTGGGSAVVVESQEESGRGRARERNRETNIPPGMKKIAGANAGLDISEDHNVITIKSGSWAANTNLVIQVPVNTSVELKSVNGGHIDVSGINGDLDVECTNGTVTLKDVSGTVVAHTINGNVTVTMDKIAGGKPMSFTSLNGKVDVTLPGDAKARLRLKTTNGTVYSDFDVKMEADDSKPVIEDGRGKGGKYKIKMDRGVYGSINGGGPEFLFQTMNGDILIHKK